VPAYRASERNEPQDSLGRGWLFIRQIKGYYGKYACGQVLSVTESTQLTDGHFRNSYNKWVF